MLSSPHTKGFTLLETMIAVTILTLSISGPLLAASRAIVLAEISRDQLAASYLAQEGIEYVRAMRDDAYLDNYRAGSQDLSNAAWTDFTTGALAWSITQCVSASCTLDPTLPMGYGSNKALNRYTSPAPLYLSGGIYTEQQIGTKTAFTRTIQATATSANEEQVVSSVSWSFHGTTYTVAVADHLTAWQ
jgi:prepilin-type N-terminal cleavage/methylation domain-containing protein